MMLIFSLRLGFHVMFVTTPAPRFFIPTHYPMKEEIERNGRGPLENGLGADSGADFHVFYIHIAIL